MLWHTGPERCGRGDLSGAQAAEGEVEEGGEVFGVGDGGEKPAAGFGLPAVLVQMVRVGRGLLQHRGAGEHQAGRGRPVGLDGAVQSPPGAHRSGGQQAARNQHTGVLQFLRSRGDVVGGAGAGGLAVGEDEQVGWSATDFISRATRSRSCAV